MGSTETPFMITRRMSPEEMNKKLLGLNIIVGKGEEKELERCLNSCKGSLFDEMVVTQTWEDENVKEVIQKYGCRREFFQWCNDFAAARNYSFSKSTTSHIMWCFEPNARVHTKRGLIPISEISIGDYVLTHKGRYMPVTKLYVRSYSGSMCRVKGKYSERSVLVTPNHEFYGCDSYQCKTGVKFCKPDCKKQWSKRYVEKYGKIVRQCKQGYMEYSTTFRPIDSYKKGDILSFPILHQNIYSPLFMSLPSSDYCHNVIRLPESIEITPEVMRLFGYFVAEGTIGTKHGSIAFCFSGTEHEYHDDVLYLMSKIFGLSGTKKYKTGTKGGGCNVVFNSMPLSVFFNSIFKGLQPVRRIPMQLLELSDLHLSEFIKGLYRGDGGENPDSFVFTTSSPYLAEQYRAIMSRFGIMSELIPYKTKKAWKVRVGGKRIDSFQSIINEIHDKKSQNSFNKGYYTDDSFIYYQLESKTQEEYTGPVYNIEVEEDHSYVVEYMTTHNCDADDEIKPSEYQKILELKPRILNYDIILIDYVYNHDEKDNPTLVLPRERIVRNCPEIKWHDPIHEYMNMDTPSDKILKTKIKIDHYRTRPYDPNRNLDALRKAYDGGKCSPRLKFYFGKELSDCGYWDESIKVLEPYLEEAADFRDNMTIACIRLSKYYYDNKNYSSAKIYALKGIRFNSIYAENYVTMANIYKIENDIDSAITYFKEAMTKKLDAGMSQIVDFYGFVPAAELAVIYFNKRELDEAIKYCDIALRYKPDHPQMLEIRKASSLELDRLSKGSTIIDDEVSKIESMFKGLNFSMELQRNNQDFADIRLRKIKKLDVVWLLPVMDLNNPSIRIRRYNVAKKMEAMGIPCRILTSYYGKNIYEMRNEIGTANTVIFTQYSNFDMDFMKHLKPLGVKIVFDHCEALFGYPFENECMKESHLIACCSTKLVEKTNEHGFGHTAWLKDAIEEKEPANKIVYSNRYPKPKAVFLGMGGNSWLCTDWYMEAIDKAGYDLVVISEWDNATVKWDPNTWPDEMTKCDVALCPQRVDVQPAKSSVKATTAMALGMPVIASPLQAYKEIIEHGKTGYICDTKDEWYEALVKLKDPMLRAQIGTAAKEAVKGYSLENVTKEWVTTLEDIINEKLKLPESKKVEQAKERNIVDIIIANYGNVEYLKMCVNSILMNTLYPFHIIISDAGSDENTWEYLKTLKGMTILGEQGKRVSFSEACNAGIAASQTKYFVILNSDVIVSKCWLSSLVDKMDKVDRLAACGVLSNCDVGWLHGVPSKPELPTYPMKLEKSGVDLVPGMKIGTIQPHVEELYSFMNKSNETYKGTFTRQPWVAAYATIFARCAINEIGVFDPLYKNGCEDWDLCQRLTRFGYVIGQAIDSFVFHFGGVSRFAYQEENRESYNKEDVENHIKMRRKWDKERVVIFTGPAWEGWTKQKVDEGMAGSETWAAYIAREFVKRGYRTTIYNDLPLEKQDDALLDPVHDGDKLVGEVMYRHHTHLAEDIKYDVVDYFISSRTLEPLKLNLHSLRNYVIVHDIWLSQDSNMDIMPWRVQGYGYLSEWHKQFLTQHHKMPADKMFLTANGLTPPDAWDAVDTYTKKNQAVYSSSPDRGLYQLLQMLPAIRERVPDFNLVIGYGFLNWESMARQRGDTEGLKFIDDIKRAMDQPGVEYVGRIPKRELAKRQMESKVWLFPSWFTETHCCHPDNEIFTEEGPKKITELNIEDRVLTHNNRFRRIEKILSRLYSGDLISFDVQNHKGGTGKYTPEHPVLILRGDNVNKLRKDRNLLRSGRPADHTRNSIKKFDKDPEWVPVKDVKIGDYVCIPYYGENNPDEWYYPLDELKKSNRNYRIENDRILNRERDNFRNLPARIKMDDDFARFLGFYFSEGSFSQGCLKFHFHEKETEYIDFIRKYIKDLMGYDCALNTAGSCTSVWCYINILGVLMKSMFGLEASQKKIPAFIFRQSKSFIREFVRAVFQGDGHENANEFKIEMATKKGICGLKILLSKINLHPSYRKSFHKSDKEYYDLGVSKSLWKELFEGPQEYRLKGTYRVYFERESKIFYKIKAISRVFYEGYVYNLEVEEDQSYTSDFLAVHNCITAVENGVSKNATLSTNLAGLSTTVGSAGILLSPDGLTRNGDYPESYTTRFVDETVRLLTDEGYRQLWASKAYTKMKEYQWSKIVDGWIKEFKK